MNYNKIKEFCTHKNISVKGLAEKIGITETGLHSAIRNNSLKIRDLEKISNVLGIGINSFFDEYQISEEEQDYDIETLEGMYDSLTIEYEKMKESLIELSNNLDQIKIRNNILKTENEGYKREIQLLKEMVHILKNKTKE